MGRYRKLPDQTDAVQYKGWNVNRQEILNFVGPYQPQAVEPLFVQYSDPGEPGVTAQLFHAVETLYHPVRDNDWIVKGADNTFYAMSPAAFTKAWEPVPLITATL